MTQTSIDLGALLPDGLPATGELVAEARRLAKDVEVGHTLYLQEKGVRSELEYRRHAAKHRIPCTAMNIGLATWADTRDALEHIYEDALRRGVRPPDRFELLAERRMGLPPELRENAPAETGPCLWTEQDWWELGHTVPIQPEAGDNMIGGPGSVPNAIAALRAGCTTVGVASQFVWRWPYWDDEAAQIAAVVTAAAILGEKKAQGTVLNGYIDDGYCGVFSDYATIVGWAMLERYAFEELLGVPYSVSWGGLTTNPYNKAVVTLALEAVNPQHIPPAYIQGDTIGHTDDIAQNYAGVSIDIAMAKLVCVRYGIAGAMIAVPVTENIRIPSWEEIADIQAANRRVESYLPSLEKMIDWRAIETEAARIADGARTVFGNFIETMRATGVDVTDALQVLLVMKRVGSDAFERLFGAGALDPKELSGRVPLLRTDLVSKTMELREDVLATVRESLGVEVLRGRSVVVASTDVHHFALYLMRSVLEQAGADVTDIGVSRDPEDIAKVAIETDADAVCVTTHNGVARSFGAQLKAALAAEDCRAAVFMGGVLNEDIEDSPTPVDVRHELWAQGIQTPEDFPSMIAELSKTAARQ